MTDLGLEALQSKLGDPTKSLPLPAFVERQLRADMELWEHFQALPHFYRRLKIGWITETGLTPSRMPEAQKRLNYFMKMTRQGKRYGTQPMAAWE